MNSITENTNNIPRRRPPLDKRVHLRPSGHGATELVTEIDLAIERLLIEAIRHGLPTATFLSEESHPDPVALASDMCFVIDPIDGTEELAAGRPNYAISIALFTADALRRQCSICRLKTSGSNVPLAPAPSSTARSWSYRECNASAKPALR